MKRNLGFAILICSFLLAPLGILKSQSQGELRESKPFSVSAGASTNVAFNFWNLTFGYNINKFISVGSSIQYTIRQTNNYGNQVINCSSDVDYITNSKTCDMYKS